MSIILVLHHTSGSASMTCVRIFLWRIPLLKFAQVKSLDKCVYTFDCRNNFTETLSTRHPVTGVLTTHICPYPNLLQFTMPGYPCLMAQGFALRTDTASATHPNDYVEPLLMWQIRPRHLAVTFPHLQRVPITRIVVRLSVNRRAMPRSGQRWV